MLTNQISWIQKSSKDFYID